MLPLPSILLARERLSSVLAPTPLVRFAPPGPAGAAPAIHLKLENLQPTRSFKVRGAGNALLQSLDDCHLQEVWTASAGNMALGLAWHARRLGIRCTAVVPADAPQTKLAALAQLGAQIIPKPFAEYQHIQKTRFCPGMTGMLVHPFADPDVMAGNGVIGLEILEALPNIEEIFIPYGGGGLSCGIASVVRAMRPSVRIVACEVAGAAPLAASLAAGRMVEVPYTPSFVSGMGAPYVFPEMWLRLHELIDEVQVVTPAQVAAAIRLLVERADIVSEGAGAVPVAAVLARKSVAGNVACIVSGGNIDPAKLSIILSGRVP